MIVNTTATLGLQPRNIGHITGCRARAVQDCTGLPMGHLGGETKAEKRRELGDLGRNKCGEKEG